MARQTKTYVAPAVAPAPVITPESADCCGNCNAAVSVIGRLECHGATPMPVYRGVVMGSGAFAEAMWPTVKPEFWCRAHGSKI